MCNPERRLQRNSYSENQEERKNQNQKKAYLTKKHINKINNDNNYTIS